MVEKMNADGGVLYQEETAHLLREKFGEEYTYINENGNLAIDRTVLKEFRALTEKTVVWERGERLWRTRERFDTPNKRQSD
jgi:hypothetical protein